MIAAKWERGFESFYKGIDANEVAQEIISIGDDATPRQIVDKARDKKTQLHKCFTWDNKVAAEQWRKQEARLLVGHLMIVRQEQEQNTDVPEVRFFHKTSAQEGYKPCFIVFTEENEYDAMLARALADLKAFQIKYKILSDREELLALIGAVETLKSA